MLGDKGQGGEMFPCGDHGERIAALEATVIGIEQHTNERHLENCRRIADNQAETNKKLDHIDRLVTETNGRLRELEAFRIETDAKEAHSGHIVEVIEEIQEEQNRVREELAIVKGERLVRSGIAQWFAHNTGALIVAIVGVGMAYVLRHC